MRFSTKPLAKTYSNNDKAEEEKDMTKAMVVDCCVQINQLKQVAFESQERNIENEPDNN